MPELGFAGVIEAILGGLHPGFVLLSASIVENGLQSAILAKMRPLSNNFKNRLFDGYGPLSSFSSKIDVAFALCVIDEQLFSNLKIIKEIRNEFAHPKKDRIVSFSDANITDICKKFSGYEGDNIKVFLQTISNCLENLGLHPDLVEAAKHALGQPPAQIP